MRKQDGVRNVAIALKLSGASGRDLLNGISTYAREHCHWRLRIFSRSEDFTPEALAEIRDLDGIITSERGTDGMPQTLEHSRLPPRRDRHERRMAPQTHPPADLHPER